MKKSCHDCLWRDFPRPTGFCPDPDNRDPGGSFCCPSWEWRYG